MGLYCAIRACMEADPDDSSVHVGLNFSAERPYCGMAHDKEPRRRCQGSWGDVLRQGSGMAMATGKELKYSHMAQPGNAARWHFLPYISCVQVIAVQKLKALGHAVAGQSRFSESSLSTSVGNGQREAHLNDQKTGDRDLGILVNEATIAVYIKVWEAGVDGSRCNDMI